MGSLNLNDLTILESVGETGIVRDGLILHLDAGNKNSYPGIGTRVFDLSGKGNHGTFNGPITWINVGGGTFSFNGSSTWISTNLNIDANPNTLCGWFLCTNVGNGVGTAVVCNDNGGWDKGWGITANQWEIHVGDNVAYSSTNVPVNNRWYFGCITYSTSNVILYINESQVYAKGSGTGATSGASAEIGRANYNAGAGSRWWPGYISNVQVYNKILTTGEITQNYNAAKWRYNL